MASDSRLIKSVHDKCAMRDGRTDVVLLESSEFKSALVNDKFSVRLTM